MALCSQQGGKIYPVYIRDQQHSRDAAPGAASNLWLYHALQSLEQTLDQSLSYYQGDPIALIRKLCRK